MDWWWLARHMMECKWSTQMKEVENVNCGLCCGPTWAKDAVQ